MATFNLIRNSKVFFTTNIDTAGVPNSAGHTISNSQLLTVLDGFSFSQNTNSDSISISEAGGVANRGTRTFNTALNPVDFSFSTYIRPKLVSSLVESDDAVLWNALLGDTAIGSSPAYTLTGITAGSTAMDAAGILTIAGTGMATTGMVAGDILIIKGVTAAGANQFNSAVKILTNPTATGFTAQYLTKPSVSLVTTGWSAAVTLNKPAWNKNAAVGTDTITTAYSEASTARSNLNKLLAFGLVVTVDGVTYTLNNCVLDQAVVDFGLDGIATVAWTGKAASISQVANNVTYTAASGDYNLGGGTYTGTIKGPVVTANTNYITNKLSTVALAANIGGGGTAYSLALTGGSITIANNVTYLTPANLGVVNIPVEYYTGNRQISGTLNAYLRTGSANTAGLLATMLTNAATSAETKFALTVTIGGASNPNKVELYGTGAAVQIPTIDAQAVMSTSINFSLQGTDYVTGSSANYDLENTNDLRIRYFGN